MMTDIPPGDYDAYIFDLDGTLADSMRIHMRAWQNALKKHGSKIDFTPELFMTLAGVGHEDTVERLNSQFNESLEPHALMVDKEAEYEAHMDTLQPIPEVVAIARQAHEKGMPIAVASGGTRKAVEHTLTLLGIKDWFGAIVTQDDVQNSKPDPEIFLLAAARLGVDPGKCVVFEDSPLGIEGAESAGMKWVKIEPRLT